MTLPIPIRASNAYVGLGKETTPGVAVAPSIFPRWLDGTKMEVQMKTQRVMEGDGTRRLSQIIKNQQYTKFTLTCFPRPVELGFLETAALGANSDTFTAPTVQAALTTGASKGASSILITNNTGLGGSGTIALDLGVGGTAGDEEVPIFTLPATGGSSPYTLDVSSTYNNNAGLKNAYPSAATLISPATHAITDQNDGNYYTVEVGLGSLNSGAGPTIRIRDCKVDTVKRSAKAGQLLEMQVEFIGLASILQSAPSTISLEYRNPFYYDTGVWTLDGATTGDALYIESFDINQKNGIDTGIQSEQLTLDATIFGAVEVTLTADAVFTSASRLYNIYYGNNSSAGATDAQAIGSGSLALTFSQVDGFNSVTYTMTTLNYTKGAWPVPKADGKHYTLSFEGESTTNQGLNTFILQTTVNNAKYAAAY